MKNITLSLLSILIVFFQSNQANALPAETHTCVARSKSGSVFSLSFSGAFQRNKESVSEYCAIAAGKENCSPVYCEDHLGPRIKPYFVACAVNVKNTPIEGQGTYLGSAQEAVMANCLFDFSFDTCLREMGEDWNRLSCAEVENR